MSGGGVPITTVGSAVSQTVTGANNTPTLAVNPTKGDLLVYAVATISSPQQSATPSGGGVSTWNSAGSQNLGTTENVRLWWGIVTTGGSSNITCSVGTPSGLNTVAAVVQEYKGGPLWVVDGSGATLSNSASTTITYPTLSPSDTGRGYFGVGLTTGVVNTTGQTAGYTAQAVTGANAMLLLYNTSVSGSQSPTSTATSGTSATVGILIYSLDPRIPILQTPIAPRMRSSNW